jgi:ubiquinone/menaquinone biosynthesis C-methylase UbiE
MSSKLRSCRWSQIVAWIAASLFAIGFFLPLVGAWTGPVLGAWFAGTQKPRRGFLWMMAFSFFPSLLFGWRSFPLNGVAAAGEYLGGLLLIALLSVLPFTFHRLVSPRLQGAIATLPLPLAGAVLQFLLRPLLPVGAAGGTAFRTFLILWFAATVVWMWNNKFRAVKIAAGATLLGVVLLLTAGVALFSHFGGAVPSLTRFSGAIWGWISLGAALVLSLWALLHPEKFVSWTERAETVACLRSPFTGDSLHAVREKGRETLVSSSGERFPIRSGIPSFLSPEDLTGKNGKYNHLYETIGGFYDDTQRVACAIRGWEIESYFRIYMDLLEAKAGDSVLETSVGTGLNFQYLPRGAKLHGLDLSAEMLDNCRNNLRRWELDADLFLGNAESLPFADSTFDVVYHAGGINFFSDRAKAIREMIRVAKPGSLLLITDETEEYAKNVYENMPVASHYFRNRQEAVISPIDLVPPEMQEIHLELIKGGQFYVITFRKPAAVVSHGGEAMEAARSQKG